LSSPYLHLIKRPARLPAEAKSEAGGEILSSEQHHALFAARVQHWPFAAIAQSAWEDFEHPAQLQLWERQLRFISALHPGRDRLQLDHRLTVELRYLRRPGAAEIECVMLGKVFDPDPERAKAGAQVLWETLSSVMPVGYAVTSAQTVTEFGTWAGYDLTQATKISLAEIRRPAEFLLWTDPNLSVRHLPVAYPFAWQPSGWETVWAAQARLAGPTLIAVSLRPTHLPLKDEIVIGEMAHILNTAAAEAQPPLSTRAAEAAAYYLDQLRAARGLFSLRVSVVGPPALRQVACAALNGPAWPRGEMASFGLAEVVEPSAEELPTALTNLTLLEQDRWGATALPEPFEQMRYLADAAGALSAFRLPLLPPAGLPGVSVGAEVPPDS
jgi:hypothetical protein